MLGTTVIDYSKSEAKDYAREHMRGVWAAALNPFNDDLSLDEAGLRSNIRHWIDDLDIKGLFIAGKQGEFFSMSLAERKRNFEIAVDECAGKAGVIVSVSDQNFDTVKELAQHAQDCGADYVVVHAPVLSFVHDRGEVLYRYYEALCERRRYRYRDVEPSRFGLSDETRGMCAHCGATQYRCDQVFRSSRHVRAG